MGFYVAFLDGLRKLMLPELIEAFGVFVQTENWDVLEQATIRGYDTAKRHAEVMSSIYERGKQKDDMKWVEDEIGKRLLIPLGIGR